MDLAESWGGTLRNLRKRAGLTQPALANFIDEKGLERGWNKYKITRLENERLFPSREVALMLINCFVLRGIIVNVDFANAWLDQARKGYLSDKEVAQIFHGKPEPSSSYQDSVQPSNFNDTLPASPDLDDNLSISGKLPIVFRLPYQRNPNFTGRKAMLDRLGAQLHQAQGITVVSQAIVGLGGVGKTQLALEYIYRQQADPQTAYDLVWWLRADTVVNLAADIAALAVAVGAISADNTDQQAAVNTARHWLLQTDKRWLLLADNADDLPPRTYVHYLPEGGKGHILITSRNQDWGGLVGANAVLPLDTFMPEESDAFWQHRLGTVNTAEAVVLSELLGNFPLAMEHAAAYMETRQIGFAAYRQLYESKRQEVWRRAVPPDRYHATITTTWEMAFAEVKKTPGALELLNLSCFLAPENIPLDLISRGVDTLQDPLVLNDAVAALHRYSLAQRDGSNLRLHRLVQTVARDRMVPERARVWAEAAVETINKVVPDGTRFHEWKEGPTIIAHMTTATDLAMEQGIETERLAFLCNRTGYYLNFRAEYERARPYYERALAIREKVLGPDHPDTARSLNNIGLLLKTIGDYEGARPYYERALAIKEKVLGTDHPDTATSLNNLGGLLQDIGDYEGARPYYERALAIKEKVLGTDHTHTQTTHRNLTALDDLEKRPG